MNPDGFSGDIAASGTHLRILGEQLATTDPWAPVRDSLANRAPVLLLGMGSSMYAASTMARWLRAAGLNVLAELSSAAPAPPVQPGQLVVGISASGGSAETVQALA